MTKNTHILGGLTLALTIEKFCFSKLNMTSFEGIINVVVFYTFVGLGSIIPDIDKKNSYIGRRLPYVSKAISEKFGHRTFTHSIIFVILVYYILKYICINNDITFGITIGILSHILLDMLNFQGVALLYPLNTKHKICKIKTNSGFEKTFRGVLILAFIWISINK